MNPEAAHIKGVIDTYSVQLKTSGFVLALALALLMALQAPAAAQLADDQTNEDQVLVVDGLTDFSFFGDSVAVDGDTVVIGAPAANNSEGLVSIFARTEDGFVHRQDLFAGLGFEDFGLSVAIDGDTIVVGAPFADIAYVFTQESNGLWNETPQELTEASAAFGFFGASVAIDGDTIVVGAPFAADSGSAYTFTRGTDGQWGNSQTLTPVLGADFGESVAIDGTTIVVGAPATSGRAGSAHVFTPDVAGQWFESETLQLPSTGLFGQSVAIDGDTILVGAPGDSAIEGQAITFVNRVNWITQQVLTPNETNSDQLFGRSVALEGDLALIGSPSLASDNELFGASYSFLRTVDTWSQHQRLVSTNPVIDDFFGWSVAIDGGMTIVVGAPEADSSTTDAAGAASVFVDSDLDTYFGSADCNDADPATFPGADEVPNDGIDQNCDGEDLIVEEPPVEGPPAQDPTPPAPIVPAVFCNGLEVTVNLAFGQQPTSGDDVIMGTDGVNVINAGDGNDTICAGDGDDIINAGDGRDVVFAGDGDDIIQLGQGRDIAYGEAGADFISGGRGKDVINGGAGDDDLRGNEGTDTINGGAGSDELRGGQKADSINGDSGDDNLVGGTRPDILDGGLGLDTYNGGGSLSDTCIADAQGLAEITLSCEILP